MPMSSNKRRTIEQAIMGGLISAPAQAEEGDAEVHGEALGGRAEHALAPWERGGRQHRPLSPPRLPVTSWAVKMSRLAELYDELEAGHARGGFKKISPPAPSKSRVECW